MKGRHDVLTLIDPLQHTSSWSYDALNRETLWLGPSGELISQGYNPDGLPLRYCDARGDCTTYHYDDVGRLEQAIYPGGITYHYTHWESDVVATETTPNGSTSSFSYDKDDRLTERVVSGGGGPDDPPVETETFSYDGLGNMTHATNATATRRAISRWLA